MLWINLSAHLEPYVSNEFWFIKEFGFTNPVLIDEDNGIIAGHGRLMAAKKLNLKTVPCIVLAGLTDAQKKAYVIADNSIALNSTWDMEKLSLEVEALQTDDFDLNMLGFNDEFVVTLLEFNAPTEPAHDSPAEFKEVKEKALAHTCPKCGYEFD
ncbi:ParB/Srx family N-terminal domain-containing protein [Endozoicomonas ascidiicola]|uniref:ParB/Srx family N-terminal domain-containing protein n=1 Tax=Endozoicomonas ascidiicola TaxID=1698521 RepID=UPI0008379694|nr:ParB/Srx family N-terminal domain-containing protein [Endozoicomonas ascidiicola]